MKVKKLIDNDFVTVTAFITFLDGRINIHDFCLMSGDQLEFNSETTSTVKLLTKDGDKQSMDEYGIGFKEKLSIGYINLNNEHDNGNCMTCTEHGWSALQTYELL